MYGYAGKIAFVDLSRNKVIVEETSENLIKGYIGGHGFLIRLLYDLVPRGADPYGPENALIFAVGPVNGTLVPSSNRYSVGTKSPATGLMVSGNAGGIWGSELKWAGFDALVVTGRAEKPCYLLLEKGKINILPADALWGKNTEKTEEILKNKHSDPYLRVVSIGQAGENMIPLATVIGDKTHSAARGGAGAVMGSKNLKAVAVRGHQGVKIADPKGLFEETKRQIEMLMSEYHYWRYKDKGSPSGTTLYQEMGAVSAYNAQYGQFDHFDSVGRDVYLDRYSFGTTGCGSCPLPGWRKYVIRDGRFAGVWTDGIENSTVQCFGTKVGNPDPDIVLVAHQRSNLYGLDEISVGVTIAFAMECYQKGIITTKDTGGLELRWGDGDVILALIDMIAHNQGFGKILGQGTKRAAEHFGRESEKFALQVKGLEISTVDPRGYQAWALQYAVSSRGAHHMRAYSTWEFGEEVGGLSEKEAREAGIPETVRKDRFSTEGKGKGVAIAEDARAVVDCLELCKTMARQQLGLHENMARMLSLVTGRQWTEQELRKVGERKNNLERLFNLREGMTAADDTLPWRVLKEPLKDGPSKGVVVNLDPMLDEYYAYRDWDRKTGYPSKAKLQELGLDSGDQ